MHSEISLGGNINNGVENPENHEQQGSGISENHEQESTESENKEQVRGEREINKEESEKKNSSSVDVEAKKEEKGDEEEYYDDIWDDYEYDDLEDTEPQVTKRPTVDFARLKFRLSIQLQKHTLLQI